MKVKRVTPFTSQQLIYVTNVATMLKNKKKLKKMLHKKRESMKKIKLNTKNSEKERNTKTCLC